MDADTQLAKLLLQIEAQKDRADHARRLARSVHNSQASQSLEAYALELEAEIPKLEAQAAVMKQAAAEEAQPSERSIAALKPEGETEPET